MNSNNNNNHNNNNTDMNTKRVRDADSDPDSAPSKRVRVVSDESSVGLSGSRFSRVESDTNSDESVLESAEARLLQDDILNILDSSDLVAERDPAIQGLDSVIKSFELEISEPEIPVTYGSGESQPELGYLLGATDDELGLPPSSGSGELKIEAVDFGGTDGVVLDENHGAFFFEDEIPSYDSFEFGIGAESNSLSGDSGLDYVALGGLFDGWDGIYENGVVSWRSESLQAL